MFCVVVGSIMSPRPRKLDERAKQRLPALWGNAELTLADIAKRFGVSPDTITALAKRMGLPARAKPARLTRRIPAKKK
jgi:AraC-like DNA-binding protein